MKRIVIVVAFISLLASPVFSQLRFDLGFDVPMTVGAISGGEVTTSSEVGAFLKEHILPFPEASVYYQLNLGPLKLAPGIRLYTIILESIFWPNVLAELQLGPIVLDAQLGGLFFGIFGLANSYSFGQVLIPDASVWLGLGKERRFRIGGGVLGLMIPQLSTEGMLIIPYLGAKIALVVK